jgi:hypothetical protein
MSEATDAEEVDAIGLCPRFEDALIAAHPLLGPYFTLLRGKRREGPLRDAQRRRSHPASFFGLPLKGKSVPQRAGGCSRGGRGESYSVGGSRQPLTFSSITASATWANALPTFFASLRVAARDRVRCRPRFSRPHVERQGAALAERALVKVFARSMVWGR